MKTPLTLKQTTAKILDEVRYLMEEYRESGDSERLVNVEEAIESSIKDALESCRVEKARHGDFDTIEPCECECHDCSWNANTTQYDENVRKFVGEK